MTALPLMLFLAAAPAAVIAPGDQLITDGVPPIPAEVAEATRAYTEARSASFAGWHPTRRAMLISTRFGNVSQLHEVRFPLGARTQRTFFPEPIGGGSYQPTQGGYIVFAKDRGGDEFSQLYRLHADGAVTLLTDGGRSQNGGAAWSTKGVRLAYGSTRRNGADRDLYVMDPAEPASDRRVLEVKGGGWGVADWSPDDSRLLVREYRSINDSTLHVLELASGKLTPVIPSRPEKVSWGGARFDPSGKRVWTTSDLDSEFQQLGVLELSTSTFTPVTTRIPWDVEDFDVTEDGATVAFVTNEEGVFKLYLLDAKSRQYRPVPGLPVGIISGLEWHKDGKELGFTLSTSRSTADAYSLDRRTLKLTRWTESELGGLDAAALAAPQLVKWKSFDGKMISGFAYRPDAKRFPGKRPVIINIHGGPEGQSLPSFIGRNNYFIDQLGVAIIYPNVRGSSGFGKSFLTLDNADRRIDSVKDIGALLDWVAEQPDLDPARVMVTGGSYGGYMTLMVATMYDDRIACSLDVVGISNLATFLKNTEAYRQDLRRAEYGDERDPKLAKFFAETAALNNAQKIKKPLFVVQGANDPRVPRSEAEQMVATVKKNGTPVWYLVGKDEGHGFRKKANADFQFYATVEFVRRFLLGPGS